MSRPGVSYSGGHNAGTVSPPGHPRRRYRMATRAHDDRYLARKPGWRRTRAGWLLVARMGGLPPLEDAPGTYVRQR